MRFLSLIILTCFLPFNIVAQNKQAYQIFNNRGKKVSYKKMVKIAEKSEILFFGELHNNAVSHWLQYELTNDLLNSKPLILGAEMFEADNQTPLNKYLNNEIDEKELAQEARLWPNYKIDYKALVDIAKNNHLKFIATNVPRRYASMVYKQGAESLDSLSTQEKAWMAPLPFAYDGEISCYKNMLSMSSGHGGDNLPKAQALKDATMAYFILKNYQSGHLFIHYNGAYHSDNHEGIVWHIRQINNDLRITTISTVNQASLKKLDNENLGKADFIICVDENMPTTY